MAYSGFQRKEAVSLLWGSSFALLFCILLFMSLIQSLILRGVYRKTLPDFPLPVSVNCGEEVSVPLEIDLPLLLPGFRCLWKTELIWEGGHRSIEGKSTLKRGHKLYHVHFNRLLRGIYEGDSGSIIVEDLFGFSKSVVFRGDQVICHVYPEIRKNGSNRENVIPGGEDATADFDRIRSEELLEVRKYHPGDDARRINWKMFALSGELYLRIGEDIPPPAGEIRVILNSLSSSIDKLPDSSLYTDELIDVYLAFVYGFVERGCIVNTLVPDMKDSLIFNPGKPDELLRVLSGITASSALPEHSEHNYSYMISHPASSYFWNILMKKDSEMKVFIKKIPESTPGSYYRQYIFKDSRQRKRTMREIRDIIRLTGEIEEDLSYLKKMGKGKIHGEII